jgi:hypothetical protein
MSADTDAKKFDTALGDYLEASTSRKAAQSAFPGKRLSVDAREGLLTWLRTPDGQERCKIALKALRAERKALKSLLKASRKLSKDAPAGAAGASRASARSGRSAKAAPVGLTGSSKTAGAA